MPPCFCTMVNSAHKMYSPHETLRDREVCPFWARPKGTNGDKEVNHLSFVSKHKCHHVPSKNLLSGLNMRELLDL